MEREPWEVFREACASLPDVYMAARINAQGHRRRQGGPTQALSAITVAEFSRVRGLAVEHWTS